MHSPICVLRETLVVCHHANRGATLMQFSEQLHHRLAIARIEVAGRFVCEQNRRPASESARDRDTLLLATRELAGQMFCAMRHAHALQGFGHKRFAIAGARAPVGQRQFDVFENRQIADQIKALKDETDLAIPNARALCEREIRDLMAFQRITAIRRSIEQAENRKQRGLAATRRSSDGNIFALPNIEVNPRERVRFYFVGKKHFGHASEKYKWMDKVYVKEICPLS